MQEEARGPAGHRGHNHVRSLLAPHTAHPCPQVCRTLPRHHPQYICTGCHSRVTKSLNYLVIKIELLIVISKIRTKCNVKDLKLFLQTVTQKQISLLS